MRAQFWSERHGLRIAADDARLTPGTPIYHPMVGTIPKCPLCNATVVNMTVVRLQGFYDDGCRQLVTTMSCCRGYIDFDEHGPAHVDERHNLQTDVFAAERLTIDPVADPVSNPPHYTFGKFEVIDVIEALGWGLAFCLGNALKYIARAGRKDPTKTKEDLEKARWYLDRAIDLVSKP